MVIRGVSVALQLLSFTAGTLVFALALNGSLSILTLEKIYSQSLLSEYNFIGNYYVKKIERSMRLGKRLEKFQGMQAFLETMKTGHPDISQIFIFSALKEHLYSAVADTPVSESAIPDLEPVVTDTPQLQKANYHLIFPLHDVYSVTPVQGYLEILLPQSLISDKIDRIASHLVKLCLLVVAISLIFLLAFFIAVPMAVQTDSRKSNLVVSSLALLLFQLIFSCFNIGDFYIRYAAELQEKSSTLGSLLQSDIDRVLHMGIPIDKLVRIEVLLNSVLDHVPELSEITIVDDSGRTVYQALSGQSAGASNSSAERLLEAFFPVVFATSSFPLRNQERISGSLRLMVSRPVVAGAIGNLILDLITVIIVSLLVAFELVLFVTRRLAVLPSERDQIVYVPVRTVAFLYAFGMAISLSFLPLYAGQLYTPAAGLSQEVAMALPLSTEMICVAVSMALAGHWLIRWGWMPPLLLGIVSTGAGVWLCGLADNTWHLIGCRALVGLGYGLTLLSTQTAVVNLSSQANRSRAIAEHEAGYYAGFVSSLVIGGILAEKLGYREVFMLGGWLLIIPLLFTLLFLSKLSMDAARVTAVPADPPLGPQRAALLSLAGSREFMATLLFSAIPGALCMAGFLYFASPLFLTDMGINQANIARLMTPSGLCVIYLVPLLSRWVDAIADKRLPLLWGGFASATALVAFYFVGSPMAFVVILILFSLAENIAYGARLSLISEALAVKRVGASKAFGLFGSLERVGDMLGPLVVGSLLAAFGVAAAVSTIGLLYLVGNILLLLVLFAVPARRLKSD